MTLENSKPEWFQMADADPIAPAPTSKRVLRLMALATPLLVLGAGLVFAQTQDSPIAVANAATQTNASAITATASANTAAKPAALPASTPSEASAPAKATIQVSQDAGTAPAPKAQVSNTIQVSQESAPAPTAPSSIAAPGIKMPTSGGEDDGSERSSDDD